MVVVVWYHTIPPYHYHNCTTIIINIMHCIRLILLCKRAKASRRKFRDSWSFHDSNQGNAAEDKPPPWTRGIYFVGSEGPPYSAV